jgi:hypothetical protein
VKAPGLWLDEQQIGSRQPTAQLLFLIAVTAPVITAVMSIDTQ